MRRNRGKRGSASGLGSRERFLVGVGIRDRGSGVRIQGIRDQEIRDQESRARVSVRDEMFGVLIKGMGWLWDEKQRNIAEVRISLSS